MLASYNRGHGCAPGMDNSKPLAFRAGARLATLEIAKIVHGCRVPSSRLVARALQLRMEVCSKVAGRDRLLGSP
ncbi:hypothetical protein MPL3365_70249 [Mesorhizobium plurifarium]|uniref:Uncharacterized protein n=1 Tax=Mesorhizobium plurifarium TaxID=69974 RepID=A0A090GH09_MESPL|nr:hypothetical protein MPL3365_70249 [Mesorhizobium plurifarium]